MGWVVAWAVANLVSLGQASNAILRENYRSILAAENMVDALERQDSAILLLFMGDTAKGIAQFRENEAVFLQWLTRAKDNITIQGEAELVQAIETDYATYRQQFSALTEVPGTHRPPADAPLRTYQEVGSRSGGPPCG
jgi:NtrC-family two-component system sensor histidine kinase KinB